MEPLITGLVVAVVGVWLGSMERRMRNLDARVRLSPSRDEVHKTIDLKQEAVKVLQQELKEDLKEINRKLDRLIEKP